MNTRNKWLAGLAFGAAGGVLLAALAVKKCRHCRQCGEKALSETKDEGSCPAVPGKEEKTCRIASVLQAAAAAISGINFCLLLRKMRGKE